MGKTITIDDEAYARLCKLKKGSRDSFSRVIHRIIPAETAGELMDFYDKQPPPEVDLERLDRIKAERGRRSGGR
jgi:predicted CopG family antitoxin